LIIVDNEKLQQAYADDGIYALQLEIGDICYQGCIYCYMNALPTEVNKLSDIKIAEILKDSRKLDITAIEWLGGEPLLRKSVFEHMAQAENLGFRNNMWTGGLPLTDNGTLRQTARYCRFGLIAVHISTVNPQVYKILHPDRPESDLYLILEAVKNLLEIGYPPEQILNSVIFTGLQTADNMIETIDYFEEKYGIKTSLNVYHTYLRPEIKNSELEKYIPGTKDVARVYKRYSRQYDVKEMPMNCVNKQYCSATIAVLCDGGVTPCATIREENAPNVNDGARLYDIVNMNRDHLIFKPFKNPNNLPGECRTCRLSDTCWGCRSRAYAAGLGIYGRDPRCYRKAGNNPTDKKTVKYE